MMLACLGALPLACAAQARRDYASRGIGAKAMPCKGTRTGRMMRQGAEQRGLQRLSAVQWGSDPATSVLTSERSLLINKEVVLFLFQLDMDSQLQRALTYEHFDMAQDVRARRQQVDAALKELSQVKGPGCGARVASCSDQMEYAPQIVTVKAQMQEAAAAERYDDAAALRDRLRKLEAAAAEAAAQYLCPVEEPRFTLGEMVVHTTKGYRGVVCGWDLACCEGTEWQQAAGVSELANGADQVFYHLLVDSRDWPLDGDSPPVAYVAEECLTPGSAADFTSDQPLVDGSFEHPYSYLLFLGADGQGNMVPARQLRDKYCVGRRDVYAPGESRWEEQEEEDGGGSSSDGNNGGGSGPEGPDGAPPPAGGAGRRKIPGIDMSSLD
ncbi:Clp protease adapter protein ClpF [Chlorella vulgaris]